jgi:hypothetical protein
MNKEDEKLLLTEKEIKSALGDCHITDYSYQDRISEGDRVAKAQHLKTLNGILDGEWLDKPDSEGWWWRSVFIRTGSKWLVESPLYAQ